MEGPSLIILKEELQPFIGKKIKDAFGNAKIDFSLVKGNKIKEIRSWGKHFLILFDSFYIRIHFLMFGSYRINERKDAVPRMCLQFARDKEINFYTSAVKIYEENPLTVYDWSVDVMADEWDATKARRKLKKMPATMVSDALLDQTIFSGVGNIIKCEVLYRIKVHPEATIGELPPRKLTALVNEARIYSFDFYNWKKKFELRKNWAIFKKKKCKQCNSPVILKYTGKTKRRSFFCENCQVRQSTA